MKPVIGIPCSTIRPKEWYPRFHGHQETYIDAIVRAGGVPVLIPQIETADVLEQIYSMLDGLLLAGGADIDPARYGEQAIPEMGHIELRRDHVEITLTQRAVADGKPVLGICRGIQVLNVALGGSLYQDIPAQLGGSAHDLSAAKENWQYPAHQLELAEGSQLAELLGARSLVINSLHHQSVKDVAPGLRATGWAEDGVIEVVEGEGQVFLMGIQCHPEALQAEADPRWQAVFRRFVESCVAVEISH
ncbi:gamma-glutamyl-gamma-aminobutyrate hydrolase family protein [Chloroflexia bacterium SDU3-3]|nr:gamma-glutamyl-gamma-aminobutyrate hydrolase family protein [Chloroflexia bacterium SDU3-3]